MLVWILSEPQHSYAHKPVAKWNNEDVRVWVEGLGEWAHGNYSEVFRKEVSVMGEGGGRRRREGGGSGR